MSKLRQRFGEVLNNTSGADKVSRIFNGVLAGLISLNVVAVLLETIESVSNDYGAILRVFEIISVITFTVEYLLRMWVSGRVRYVLSPMAVIDLLAILSFYLPFFLPIDMRFLRVLRLVRLMRIFKLGRYSDALQVFGRVLTNKKSELYICAS